MEDIVDVVVLLLVMSLVTCQGSPPFWDTQELLTVKTLCDAQCEAFCQEETRPSDECKTACTTQQKKWITNCPNGGNCTTGYCSVHKHQSNEGYLPAIPVVKVLRDPVTRVITLGWELDKTRHKVIYIVQWDQGVYAMEPPPSDLKPSEKHTTWYTRGWVNGDSYTMEEPLGVCVRPLFRVASVSKYGSRWFTKAIQTPEIAPGPVQKLSFSQISYNPRYDEISFKLYWQEPEGWKKGDISTYHSTKHLERPCRDFVQDINVYADSIQSNSMVKLRISARAIGCTFTFWVRAISGCNSNEVGPLTPIRIHLNCSNVVLYTCPTPKYYPPGNVKNIALHVIPSQGGIRVLVGWSPPSDKGSVGVIDTYHVIMGKLVNVTYNPFLGLGSLYNTSTVIVPGNTTWTDIYIGNSSGFIYGIQIIPTVPGHPVDGMNIIPVHALPTGPRDDEISWEQATILKDDHGVVIVLIPRSKTARVYVTKPRDRSSDKLGGFVVNYGRLKNDSTKLSLWDKEALYLAKESFSVDLRHLEEEVDYGVQVIPHYNASEDINDTLDELAEESEVHVFRFPRISDPEPNPVAPDKKPPWTIIGVATALGVLVLVFIGSTLMYIRRAKHTRKLDHLIQQRQSDDSRKYFDIGRDVSDLRSPPVVADGWELPHSCLRLGPVLGSGAFGLVLKGQITRVMLQHRGITWVTLPVMDKKDTLDVTVAVKMLQDGVDTRYYYDFIKEINLMKRIGYHENVVSMLGCCTLREPICLVVEHVQRGDLLHYLKKIRPRMQAERNDGHYQNISPENLNTLDLLSFARQIARGMEFLASKSFIHRDLAARNILVDDNKILKIGDFGLTRFIYDDKVYVNRRGGKLPIKWMSVEAIFELTFSTASDVWSYGIVLFELMTLGGTPYPGIATRELLTDLRNGYRMEKPDNCSAEMYQLMRDCWSTLAQERPSFSVIGQRIDTMIEECSGVEHLDFRLDESQDYYQAQTSEEDDSVSEVTISQEVLDEETVGNEEEEDSETSTDARRGVFEEVEEEEEDSETSSNDARRGIFEGSFHDDRKPKKRSFSKISNSNLFIDSSSGLPRSKSVKDRKVTTTFSRKTRSQSTYLKGNKIISTSSKKKRSQRHPQMKNQTKRVSWIQDENGISVTAEIPDIATSDRCHLRLQVGQNLEVPKVYSASDEEQESDSSCGQVEGSDDVFNTAYSYLSAPNACPSGSDSSLTDSEHFFESRIRCLSRYCSRKPSAVSTTSIDSGLPQSPTQGEFHGYVLRYSPHQMSKALKNYRDVQMKGRMRTLTENAAIPLGGDSVTLVNSVDVHSSSL